MWLPVCTDHAFDMWYQKCARIIDHFFNPVIIIAMVTCKIRGEARRRTTSCQKTENVCLHIIIIYLVFADGTSSVNSKAGNGVMFGSRLSMRQCWRHNLGNVGATKDVLLFFLWIGDEEPQVLQLTNAKAKQVTKPTDWPTVNCVAR